jgi:hypothetical protein
MTHAMKEGLWLRLFLKLHDLPVPHPFPLLCDNQSTLALVQSESVSSRSKHIDIRYHFIREHVSDGTFTTTWIPTEDMTADILTKPLHRHFGSMWKSPGSCDMSMPFSHVVSDWWDAGS